MVHYCDAKYSNFFGHASAYLVSTSWIEFTAIQIQLNITLLETSIQPDSNVTLVSSSAHKALAARAAPTVSLTCSSVLDTSGLFFISYDGLVNVESFQQSALLSYQGYQYAVWYTSSRTAVIARRQLSCGTWTKFNLGHSLSTDDSHNVISIGVSPDDGRVHIALDSHSTQTYYTKSVAGLATNPDSFSWTASNFPTAFTNTLGNLNVGR